MDNRGRFVFGGAVLGAVLGALLGWGLSRRMALPDGRQGGSELETAGTVDTRRLVRLGMAVIGVIRQVLELG